MMDRRIKSGDDKLWFIFRVLLLEKSLVVQRQMHPDLECRVLLGHEQPGVIGNRFAERRDPGAVALGEIGQYVTVHQFLDAGVADPEPHPAIVVADMRGDRTQTVVAGNAAADLDAHLARRQFELILKHDDLARRELEEIRGLLNRAPRLVHEGRGPEQHHPLAIERAFRGLALKTAAPWCETMTPRNFIDDHEPDIMPVMGVLRAGIAEANKESHDAASRARLLLLVAASRRFGAGHRRMCTSRGSSPCRRRSSTCRRRGTGRRRSSRTGSSGSSRSRL